MNISGIRPVSGFYDYNQIDAVRSKVEEVAAVEEPQVQQDELAVQEAEPKEDAREQQTFGAYDYVKQYNPDQVYSMKGENSDIRSLDVQKAISDMQKDQVIQQYHYFVGSGAEAQNRNAAPMVRGVEDFSL